MDAAGPQGPWAYLVPLIAIGIIVLRGVRTRTLQIERMWIMPALVLATVAMSLSAQPPSRFAILAIDIGALGAGLGFGWWRGRTTTISIDPATHALTSRASPLGMALIAGLFLIRFALRDYAATHAAEWHVRPAELAEIFLLFAAGLVCAQRLEMWIRARGLLNAARGERRP